MRAWLAYHPHSYHSPWHTVLLHPDKQPDEAHRELASEQFRRIQTAYQVLSDPNRRAVYDQYGEAGLEYAQQVGQKLKSPEEVSFVRASPRPLVAYLNNARLH